MGRIYFTICTIVALCATSCHHKGKKESMPPLSVEVTEVQSKPTYDHIEVASKVASLYEVIIQPRIDGFLSAINYEEGMPIKRGELLFVIDPDQYKISQLSAEAEVESAKAQELLAHRNYQRAIPLAKIDAISKSDLDQYEATHSAALASVRSAQEARNNANLNLSYTKIYAPIDGIIANTPANEGDYVGPSTALSTLTTISYIDTVEVEIPIPTNTYMQYITPSNKGSFDNRSLLSDIELTLSGNEPYPHKGEYHYTLKDSPTASSTVVIVAKFANPELKLKSGMFARVRANIGAQRDQIIIPQRAVNQNQGVNSVWVVKPDSTMEFRRVKLGKTTSDNWIITEGLTPGESVLLTGQLKVHNGAKVKPIKR